MSEHVWLDDSENTSSNGETNYSEADDVNTENETKSAHSNTDSYSDENIVIERFENVISNEKNLLDYNAVHNVDHRRTTKSTSCQRTSCKFDDFFPWIFSQFEFSHSNVEFILRNKNKLNSSNFIRKLLIERIFFPSHVYLVFVYAQ